MFTIIERRLFSDRLGTWTFSAPEIARHARPGQFVMLRLDDPGERIPFSLCDWDPALGTITCVITVRGRSTHELVRRFREGDTVRDLAGPLGRPSEIARFGRVLLVGEGAAAGALWPILRELDAAGNDVTVLLGFTSQEERFWEERFARHAREVRSVVAGESEDTPSLLAAEVERLLAAWSPDRVVVYGSNDSLERCAAITRSRSIPTVVSLKSLMLDGTGLCGSCRVRVDGEVRFACFEGPEFDGHLVDYDDLRRRQDRFAPEEAEASGELERRCRARRDLLEEGRHNVHKIRQIAHRAIRPAERSVGDRLSDFEEVEPTYRWAEALAEAGRCLQCANPACISGCPAQVDIPAFIQQILVCDVEAARDVIDEAHAFPSICGRVCSQERQCEASCIVGRKVEPVAIGRLERFVGDRAPERKVRRTGVSPGRVAIIGSGPAGLSCAEHLARRGAEVTVFEGLHAPGGLLRLGIPTFVLPAEHRQRAIDRVLASGVEIRTNTLIGRTPTLTSLMSEQGYRAIYLAAGAGHPTLPGIAGENARQVYTAGELLTRVNLMGSAEFPYRATPLRLGERVVILGGGNTALDCARIALRFGAPSVHVVYRRTRAEAPVRTADLRRALHEGTRFHWLHAASEILTDDEGNVRGVRLQPMRLGDIDPDGRRRPEASDEQPTTLACDSVLLALGSRVSPIWRELLPDLEADEAGRIRIEVSSGATSMPGVFAGGDAVTGPSSVIVALASGRIAARGILDWLEHKTWPPELSGQPLDPRLETESCPRCSRPVSRDDESICCADSPLAWRCLGCRKRSEGIVFPYGFCPACGGTLELIEGVIPTDAVAARQALEVSLGGITYLEQAASETRDAECRMLLELLAQRKRAHLEALKRRYHVELPGMTPVSFERVALHLGVAPPEGDAESLLQLALAVTKMELDTMEELRDAEEEGSKAKDLFCEMVAEATTELAELETELRRHRCGEPGLL
ncbi:MAG: sulfide/dihydroorotate dehydrogenase-like FAD/NAD-binding protein [Planctomycetota bacterium]